MHQLKDELITPETSDMAVRCGFDRFKVMESIQLMPDEDPSIIYQPPVTQSLLARWLREVHQLSVGVYIHEDLTWQWIIQKIGTRKEHSVLPENITGKPGSWNSYELALEAGLQEALKLIPDL